MKRYKSGEHPEYDQALQLEINTSFILNEKKTSLHNPPLNSEEDYKALLYQLEGDQEGRYVNERGYEGDGLIRAAQRKITDIESDYQQYRTKMRLQGYPVPKEMKVDMKTEYLKWQAKEDARKMEVTLLKEALSKIEVKKEENRYDTMFKYGLRGESGKDRTPIEEIDGQRCEVRGEHPYIVDDLSPFNGMRVLDYRKMAKQWREQFYKDKDAFAVTKPVPKDHIPKEWPDYALKNKLTLHVSL